MFIISSFLTLFSSLILSFLFDEILLVFICFFSFVILNMEILSLLKAVSDLNILILSFIEFVICLIFWKIRKFCFKFQFDFSEFKNILKTDKLFFILLLALFFMLLINFLTAFYCPPNEPDATAYHALRVLFWADNSSIVHIPYLDIRNSCMPVNSELFYFWLFVLSKKDTMFGSLQFFSYFFLIMSSYKTMELIKIPLKRRLWGILIFSSLPMVIVQISSLQTDIVLASLLSFALYFLLKFKQQGKNYFLYFSSLSFAVALGTKTSVFFAGVPVLIFAIFYLGKDFFKFLFFLLTNFLIFSSYNYLLNYINYGNFVGNSEILSYHQTFSGLKMFVLNCFRYLFHIFDFSALKPMAFFADSFCIFLNCFFDIFPKLSQTLWYGASNIYDISNFHMNEQISGFGFFGSLIFIYCFIKGFFNKNLKLFSLIFLFQFILLCASITYSSYSIRYFLSFSFAFIPLFSLFYYEKNNVIKFITSVIIVYFLCFSSLFSFYRPFYYLFPSFLNKKPEFIQSELRDLKYDKVFQFEDIKILSNEILDAYIYSCKNNKKAVFYAKGIVPLYSAKYYSYTNKCNIDIQKFSEADFLNPDIYDTIIFMEETGKLKNKLINKKFGLIKKEEFVEVWER